MKRKKLLLSEKQNIIFSDQKIKISKLENRLLFEIGKEITDDVAEGVSLLLMIGEKRPEIWNIDITSEEISPHRSLFWLTGGVKEWKIQNNYTKSWSDSYLDFQEEFGLLILNIVKRSKKLSDIKNDFENYLNLPILYDFALSKNLVK